jgi:septal ring factor EnvC (AmiA/AmiB activator)
MFCAALLAFVGARPSASLAQDEAIDLFKREMAEMQSTMKKMAERIEQLEAEREGTNGKIARVEQSMKTVQSAPSALNPAIGMAIDATAEHRVKTGGDFNFRAAEIGISASIDPYARAYAFFNGSKDGVEDLACGTG